MYPSRVVRRTLSATDADGGIQANERRAIERVLAGEPAAFRVLVERHQRGVHAVITRLVGSAPDAEDLTQQAFLSAYDALAEFKLEYKFSSWLYRIAVNLAKDHLKSKRRGEVASGEQSRTEEAVFAGRVPPPDADAVAHERERLLERALAELSFDDRRVLVLKDIEELPYEEIRRILRRPVTALKIRVVRARARLRAALARLAGEGAL
jgi:RNA polymerase sigma-70 factor, ECF subfamily